MIFEQNWQGYAITDGKYSDGFNVTVPGYIQKDYGIHMGWGDVNWMDNCCKYIDTEDWYWSYKTNICYQKNDRQTFADFLYNNTRLEKGPTAKDKYGYLEKENGVYYFKLNLKIGLVKR